MSNDALNGKSARIIINEVIGSNRTTLSDNLKIVGNKADLLVVNSNGLTCNGCSFTNVD